MRVSRLAGGGRTRGVRDVLEDDLVQEEILFEGVERTLQPNARSGRDSYGRMRTCVSVRTRISLAERRAGERVSTSFVCVLDLGGGALERLADQEAVAEQE